MSDAVIRKRKAYEPLVDVLKRPALSATTCTMRKLKKLTVIGVLALLLLLFVSSWWSVRHGTGFMDHLALRLGFQEEAHVVVVDAGSTGTRVLAFTFHKSRLGGTLRLDRELFKEVKPGLSSFVKTPEKVAEGLGELLSAAALFVPADSHARTPIILRATAGLRLLPESGAEALLEAASQSVRRSGFHVQDNSVSIMSGVDEGLFSWFTVNFLLDRLGGDPADTVAVFDLGGGSSQVTFAPADADTVRTAPPGHIIQVSALHTDLGVYSKSYLGAGLMAARHRLLTAGLPDGTTDVVSSCVNPIAHTTWEYAGKQYNIKGADSNDTYKYRETLGAVLDHVEPVVDYPVCHRSAADLLADQIHAPAELKQREVYAISYFFDRAAEAGLVDPLAGGSVNVKRLLETARVVCETPNVDQPLACLDLAYIGALLRAGLQLDGEHVIQLRKKIDGHETSWALGAAYHALTNQRE